MPQKTHSRREAAVYRSHLTGLGQHLDEADESPGSSFDFAKTQSGSLNPTDVLHLQKTVGNQAVQRLLASRNTAKPSLVQREVMSVSDFQKLTYIRAASRKKSSW